MYINNDRIDCTSSSCNTTTTVHASVELSEEQRESGFYNENGHPKQADRPAINPDFDPDESCDLDVYQLKCIPGLEQECPEGFGNNEDGQCHPTGPCPDGHHYEDEDESGQCYPNNEGCGDYGPFVLIEEEDGGDRCALLYYICDEAEHSSKDYCIEYCKENPERSVCNRTE